MKGLMEQLAIANHHSLEPNNSINDNNNGQKNVKPNEIFNVFNNPIPPGMVLPPLPMKNALTVEDIEKL